MATSSPPLEISSDEVFTDDEIDCWKLPRAMRVAKEKCISLGKTRKLEEIRCHLKLHLLADRQLRSNTGMIIVDSPGIGDTEEMTEITLNYLVEACAFIYIVNSSAAGGVQEDRLLKLLQFVCEKAFKDHGAFRPECAMFICNKWDQVPTTPVNEREPVWQMTKTQIMKHWQCDEAQLFRLSTKEAAFIQKEGYVCGRFNKILSEINKLIPLSREILIETCFRQLLNFVNNTIIYCSRYLIHEALPKDKRDILAEARQKLDEVKTEIDNFFHSKIKHIESRLKTIVEKLQIFLSDESNIKSLGISLDEEIPQNHNWQNTTLAVRAKIYERFEKLLTTWEYENGHFRCIGQDVSQEFTSQLPKFNAKIQEVERTFLEKLNHLSDQKRSLACSEMEMEGETFEPKDICPILGFLDIDLENEDESEITLIPSSIMNQISELNLGEKIFLGVTLTFSPLLLIGMAVMVPLYWKRELERKLKRTGLESKFSGTTDILKKKKIVRKYVDNIIGKLAEPMYLNTVIRQSLGPVQSYIEEQQFKLVYLIDRDLKLLQSLKDDDMSEKNKRVYEPVRCVMESFQRYLLFHQVKLLHRQPIEINI